MLVALLAALAAGAPSLQAENASGARAVQIPRVDEPPRLEWFVDGTRRGGSDGGGRPRGAPVTDFRQREPGDGTPVSQPTTAFLSYDADNLYVVFVCGDDPAAIRANVARREDIEADDAVGLYLDTFHDRQRAYVFMANPLGVQLDLFQTEGQDDDVGFDTLWHSEGRLTAEGYVVRMAIPFRSLRFAGDRVQTWGIALARVIRRGNEEAYWPFITRREQGFVPQFGTLQGLRDVSPGRNVQITPYGALARARFLDEDAPAFRTDGEGRVGLDAKLVFRDAVALDATVNPDFSQVESDDPQAIVNERFEVSFPEKRPFFLENAGRFQTPIDLFFSRRIVDPLVGARVTGKLGRWALGAIAMNDRSPEQRAPDDPLAGRKAAVGAFRLQRQIGAESAVGFLVTGRELGGSSHLAYSVDTRVKLGANWAADAQAVRSEGGPPHGARPAGWGVLAGVESEGRHLEYTGRYLGLTRDFAAPLGFVPRVGVHHMEQEVQLTRRPDGGPLVSFGPAIALEYVWDRDGLLQDREIAAAFEVELTRATEMEIGRVERFERFEGVGFHLHATELSFSTEWLKWLAAEASYAWGTAVNHDPAPGVEPFLGRASEAEVALTLRPTPRWRLDGAFLAGRLARGRTPVFTERRLRAKMAYQFSRSLSLRAIVDRAEVVPNRALSAEEEERGWSADVLLTWLAHPGTALYVGYTDRYLNLALWPGPPPEVRRTLSPGTSVGRQLFARLSYTFRF